MESREDLIAEGRKLDPLAFDELVASSKTEGEDRPLAAALYLLDPEQSLSYGEGETFVARVDRYHVWERSDGFIEVVTFADVETAEKKFAELEEAAYAA